MYISLICYLTRELIICPSLGDGFTVLQFLRLLSQNYQGLEPLDTPPSHEMAPEYPLNPDAYGDIPVPEFAHSYPLRGIPPYLEPGRKKPGRVNIRMTASQIAQVQKGVVAQCPDGKPPIISRQDALVALLAHCVSKSDPETTPIQHISTIVMVRSLPCSSIHFSDDSIRIVVYRLGLRRRWATVSCGL